eukprot:6248124-Ditylum_brightwellii.AAC.1
MEACGAKQLCAGLWSGIKGGIHAIDNLWQDCRDDNSWGILLVDARNAFSKLNRMAMLCHVHHIWPAGSRYLFNAYQHWKILVIWGGVNLHSKEGVTQGDPLTMILYALGVLHIIDHLEQYESQARLLFLLQIWYADDFAFASKFPEIKN